MKRFLTFVTALIVSGMAWSQVSIQVKSGKPAGNIDPMLYGQLFLREQRRLARAHL